MQLYPRWQDGQNGGHLERCEFWSDLGSKNLYMYSGLAEFTDTLTYQSEQLTPAIFFIFTAVQAPWAMSCWIFFEVMNLRKFTKLKSLPYFLIVSTCDHTILQLEEILKII